MSSPRRWQPLRLSLLALGAMSLLAGLWTGLERLGLPLPAVATPALVHHSAFMISGFLGTVISLERAVALGRPWAYLAPALSAAGAIVLILGSPGFAAFLFLAAGLALTAGSALIAARHTAVFTITLAVAALCWAVGTLVWIAGQDMPAVSGWWLLFLILTIAAERLELSRLLQVSRASQAAFVLIASLVVVGAMRSELDRPTAPSSGLGLCLLTLWLVRHDVATRTIRQTGQARFSAACMLAGYVWLGAAGVLLLVAPPGSRAFSYDAAVHAVALGFVLSMIFGHAPIILPAVTGLRLRFTPVVYGPLALLHGAVLIRVAADLLELDRVRSSSGVLTVIALASYAGSLAATSWRRGAP
jgi:hypothetical protein